MTPGQCGTVAPNGNQACTKLSGHNLLHGIPGTPSIDASTCANPSTGLKWCGYCGTWSCERHGVTGRSRKSRGR